MRDLASAPATGDLIERNVELAGAPVRFRFIGPTASAVGPAFTHLEVPSNGTPSATVTCWDGTSGPPPPFRLPPARAGDGEGASCLWEDAGRHLRWWPSVRLLVCYDSATGEGTWWVPDATRTPWFERAAPLRSLFDWWATDRGLCLLHGAAVGVDGTGILLCGPGGSGKSTTAVACARAGLTYAGDDYVLLAPGDVDVAHAIYKTAKLDDRALQLLPGVDRATVGTTPEGKALVDVARFFPGQLVKRLAISAVVVPVISADQPRVTPAAPGDALRALAPSTLLQHATRPRATLDAIAALVRRLPCFRLELGPEPLAAAAVVEDLVVQVSDTPA